MLILIQKKSQNRLLGLVAGSTTIWGDPQCCPTIFCMLFFFFPQSYLFIFQNGCWGTSHQALILWPKAIPSLCICVCGILFSFETGSYSIAQASLELTIARLASSLQWSPCLRPSFAGLTNVRQYTWTRACCARQSYVVLSWISLIRTWWNGFTDAREPK